MSETMRCELHAEIQNAGERIREYVAHLETDAAFTILKRQQAESELAAEKAKGERLRAAIELVLRDGTLDPISFQRLCNALKRDEQ